MVFDPVEGLHYPGSTGDFLAWFRSDVDCLDYLEQRSKHVTVP